jgi:hypothetical protein
LQPTPGCKSIRPLLFCHILPAAKIPGADASVEDDPSYVEMNNIMSNDEMMTSECLPPSAPSNTTLVAMPTEGVGHQATAGSFTSNGHSVSWNSVDGACDVIADVAIDEESDLGEFLMSAFESLDPVDALIVMDMPELSI